MSSSPPSLWLVIPAWREAERINTFAGRPLPALAASGLPVTLQIVEDGSPAPLADARDARGRAWRKTHPFLRPLHRLPVNRGKGAAVRAGWDLAAAEGPGWLGFCDADRSGDADEIVRLARFEKSPLPGSTTRATGSISCAMVTLP